MSSPTTTSATNNPTGPTTAPVPAPVSSPGTAANPLGSYTSLSNLHKKEKVLVQYRLLKDLDYLTKHPLPGVSLHVKESNLYEWHVTIAPLSGHFTGLKV
ncbi:unnamed protein product, partial [Amoebophrya sp. A120]|eukprot:GSA120T00000130001.1